MIKRNIALCLALSAIISVIPINTTNVYAASKSASSEEKVKKDPERTFSDESLKKMDTIETASEKNKKVHDEVYNNLTEYQKIKKDLYTQYFLKSGVIMGDLEEYEGRGAGVLATTDYRRSSMTLKDLSEEKALFTMYHEIGHMIDAKDEINNDRVKTNGGISRTDRFKEIFEKEKHILAGKTQERSDLFTSMIGEYFAECFAIYKTNAELLKQAPLTYEFMEEVNEKEYKDLDTSGAFFEFRLNFFIETGRYELAQELIDKYKKDYEVSYTEEEREVFEKEIKENLVNEEKPVLDDEQQPVIEDIPTSEENYNKPIYQPNDKLEQPIVGGNDGFGGISNGNTADGEGKWVKEGDIWFYYDGESKYLGWLLDDDKWYYLSEDGSMATGWKEIYGQWYFFSDNGSLHMNQWIFLNNKWYYLNESGVMRTGWLKDKNNTYFYLDESGAMVTGWSKINGIWYYFYDNGSMAHSTTINGYELAADGSWIE